jgi:protein-S-isoprenylcysteine O-methyltransferase Ste14
MSSSSTPVPFHPVADALARASLPARVRVLPLVAIGMVAHASVAALFFEVAGTTELPWVWATFATLASAQAALVVAVFRRDPALVQERLRPGAGAPSWDRAIANVIGLVAAVGLAVAALDLGRLHVSDVIPRDAQALGLLGIGAGAIVMGWAIRANTFFSRVVRIQRERGHRVISSGPYGLVRHPGYLAWMALWTGASIALGSWLGVAVAALACSLLVIRTWLEDRFLHRELEGYGAYAARVRYRLLPGIW